MDVKGFPPAAAAEAGAGAAGGAAPAAATAGGGAGLVAYRPVMAEKPKVHGEEYHNPAARVAKDKDVEDAQLLKLGPDFEGVRCLWNAEVAIILEHRIELQNKEDSDVHSTPAATGVMKSTLEYVNLFKNYKNKEAIQSARLLNKDGRLHAFELAVINNLNVETVEEALTLIPTLKSKFKENDPELEALLDAIKRHQDTA